MTLEITARFLSLEQRTMVDKRTGEATVIYLAKFYVDGGELPLYIANSAPIVDDLIGAQFGDTFQLNVSLVPQQGNVYKLKFVSGSCI